VEFFQHENQSFPLTPSSWVTITVLLGHIFTILSAKKLNSSVLMLLSLKKLRQFCGIFPLSVTLRLEHILPILQDLGVEKLWVAIGQGQSLKWIPIHDISPSIGPEKSKGLCICIPW
jgi:hypothetical protein